MLSEAVNHQIYGKCNNPNGHGHNYNGKYATVVIAFRSLDTLQISTWSDEQVVPARYRYRSQSKQK